MHFDFPTFLVLACAFTGAVWLIDVLFLARKRRERARFEDVKEPVLIEYSRSFFPVILIVLIVRSFLFEPFRIPSGSMMPTLLVGDFILVNKYKYGLRLPVLNEKVVELGEPQRGDVVVFRYPQNPRIDYIKRVVGVPGDRVAYRNKVLYVNGDPAALQPDGVFVGEGGGARDSGALQFVETLGDVNHKILINPRAPNFAPGCQVLWEGEIKVPDGRYFVMGDNRDNSNDGRCWGFVPDANLVGKAVGIWMSWDSDRSGFPVDWGRIGESID